MIKSKLLSIIPFLIFCGFNLYTIFVALFVSESSTSTTVVGDTTTTVIETTRIALNLKHYVGFALLFISLVFYLYKLRIGHLVFAVALLIGTGYGCAFTPTEWLYNFKIGMLPTISISLSYLALLGLHLLFNLKTVVTEAGIIYNGKNSDSSASTSS